MHSEKYCGKVGHEYVKTRNNAKKYSRTKLKNTKWGKTNVSMNEVAIKCAEQI